jgi:hypothetical protein
MESAKLSSIGLSERPDVAGCHCHCRDDPHQQSA